MFIAINIANEHKVPPSQTAGEIAKLQYENYGMTTMIHYAARCKQEANRYV